MKPKKINISSKISETLKHKLKSFIGHPIQRFMIGGNFGIYGTLNDSKYQGNQVNICFNIKGDVTTQVVLIDWLVACCLILLIYILFIIKFVIN